jgi:hypothetical protein
MSGGRKKALFKVCSSVKLTYTPYNILVSKYMNTNIYAVQLINYTENAFHKKIGSFIFSLPTL